MFLLYNNIFFYFNSFNLKIDMYPLSFCLNSLNIIHYLFFFLFFEIRLILFFRPIFSRELSFVSLLYFIIYSKLANFLRVFILIYCSIFKLHFIVIHGSDNYILITQKGLCIVNYLIVDCSS